MTKLQRNVKELLETGISTSLNRFASKKALYVISPDGNNVMFIVEKNFVRARVGDTYSINNMLKEFSKVQNKKYIEANLERASLEGLNYTSDFNWRVSEPTEVSARNDVPLWYGGTASYNLEDVSFRSI